MCVFIVTFLIYGFRHRNCHIFTIEKRIGRPKFYCSKSFMNGKCTKLKKIWTENLIHKVKALDYEISGFNFSALQIIRKTLNLWIFFWKKRRLVCAAFLSKGGHWKKTAPAAGFIQKHTFRTSASSFGGPGAEPRKKLGLWHKGLSVFFSFSSGQVRCPINFPVAAWATSSALQYSKDGNSRS